MGVLYFMVQRVSSAESDELLILTHSDGLGLPKKLLALMEAWYWVRQDLNSIPDVSIRTFY
jgi:hypothetical protein